MSLRLMADGITPANLPAGLPLYAAYVDGQWPNFDQLATRFPDAVHVPISNHYNLAATVLDFGEGSATSITAAITWAEDKRRIGEVPSLYCNLSQWTNVVRPSFEAAGVTPPWWWGAQWNDQQTMFADVYAVAHQYEPFGGYDLSVVKAYWPGVDPAPKPLPPPPPPPPAPQPEEDDMTSISVITVDKTTVPAGTPWPGVYALYNQLGKAVHVDATQGATSNVETFCKLSGQTAAEPVTWEQYQDLAPIFGLPVPTPTGG